jgi:hypothetical protein
VSYVLHLPEQLQQALRERARVQGKSIGEIVLQLLERALGLQAEAPPQRDLADIAGTWQEDPERERLHAEQRRVDPDLWH